LRGKNLWEDQKCDERCLKKDAKRLGIAIIGGTDLRKTDMDGELVVRRYGPKGSLPSIRRRRRYEKV